MLTKDYETVRDGGVFLFVSDWHLSASAEWSGRSCLTVSRHTSRHLRRGAPALGRFVRAAPARRRRGPVDI